MTAFFISVLMVYHLPINTNDKNNIPKEGNKSGTFKITQNPSEENSVEKIAQPSNIPEETINTDIDIGKLEKSDTSIITQNSSKDASENLRSEEIKTKDFGFSERVESQLNKVNVANNVKDYETALKKLNYLDINSVSEAIALFKKYASDEKKLKMNYLIYLLPIYML